MVGNVMKVCANTWVVGVCRVGEAVDLPDEVARDFIERGIASPVDKAADKMANDEAADSTPSKKRNKKK